MPDVNAEQPLRGLSPTLGDGTLRRVNPYHLWSGLTKDQQKTIGALAVARTLAELRMIPGEQNSWMAAELAIGDALFEAVTEAVGNDQLMTMSLPDLSVIGTPSCQVCGCTDACGCPEGCWWIAPGLCSSCAPRVVEAAADTAPELLAFIEPGKGTAPDADPTLLACLNAGLIEFYSGRRGQTAWVATRLGKLLTVAAASAREVEAHD